MFHDARRRRNVVPFLFMTAYSDIDQAVRLMKAGASDYVTKPFEMQTLLQRLTDIAPGSAKSPEPVDLRSARGGAEKIEIEPGSFGDTRPRRARRQTLERLAYDVVGAHQGAWDTTHNPVQKTEHASATMFEILNKSLIYHT